MWSSSKTLITIEGFEQQDILERPLKLTVSYVIILQLNEKGKNIVILITTIIYYYYYYYYLSPLRRLFPIIHPNPQCLYGTYCSSYSAVTIYGICNVVSHVECSALLHSHFPQCVSSAKYGCFLYLSRYVAQVFCECL
jgi:hypothetical protein